VIVRGDTRSEPSFALPQSARPGGLRIGYVRVSTDDQSLDHQLDALRAAGCSQVYEEKISGSHAKRPELDHALRAANWPS
jgi:hypothetical protein